MLAEYILQVGVVFYGGNFAVRREALDRIGGFDQSIEFHAEDTNLEAAVRGVPPCRAGLRWLRSRPLAL